MAAWCSTPQAFWAVLTGVAEQGAVGCVASGTFQQLEDARQTANSLGATIETKSSMERLSELTDWATAVGILLALGVLVMSVGLIPSGTAGELRILTATGASGVTRSTLAGTTAGRRPVAARMNRGRLIAGDRSGPTGFADEGLHLLRQWSANGNGQLPRLPFRTTAAVEQTQACLIGLLTSQPGCATSCSRRLPKLTTSSTV